MNTLIEKHFEKLLQGSPSAAGDYSGSLVCIARTGGDPEALNLAGAKTLLTGLFQEGAFQDAQILVNRTTENYGVLTVQSGFAPFLSYACIIRNGKIAGMTLYAYRPVKNIMPPGAPIPKCKDTRKMFNKHFRAMFSMKARVITKDYAEDGVVITNMARDICDGKPQIYDFCDHLMKNTWRLLRKMNFHGITSVRWKIRSAEKGLLLFTMEAPAMNMVMTETYWVENGKIRFECSIACGDMLDLVHKMLY